MKDEEMAEQFADNISGLELTCSLLSAKDKSHAYRLGRYDGFLAGLKAGRPQWHDLRKDKNDLPPKMVSNHNFSIEVLSDKGEIVRYNFHYCEWFYWTSGSPIAWCEIPTFDKE